MKKITLALVCLIYGASCTIPTTLKTADDGNNMAFDSVRFVREFPLRYQVSEGTEVNTNLIGLRDFTIHDSLMVVMTTNPNGYWAFLSMPDFKVLGRYLFKGNGPNEFFMPPYVSQATIYKKNDRLYIIVLNQIKRRLLRMDVDSTLHTKILRIETLNDSLPRSLFGFAYINDTTYFCRTITNDETQQVRFFLENNKKRIPAYIERLNNARIRRGGDFNYLSSIFKCNLEKQIIVEMSSTLNHINLYSFDGSKTLTICVGEKLDDIDELQELPKWKMPYSYMNLRVYPHFFGVLFLGETKKSFQTKRAHTPKIQLFDWNGEPLAEILLNRQATSFDIDFANKNLYILDGQTEEFYRYDIGNLLAIIDHEQ